MYRLLVIFKYTDYLYVDYLYWQLTYTNNIRFNYRKNWSYVLKLSRAPVPAGPGYNVLYLSYLPLVGRGVAPYIKNIPPVFCEHLSIWFLVSSKKSRLKINEFHSYCDVRISWRFVCFFFAQAFSVLIIQMLQLVHLVFH